MFLPIRTRYGILCSCLMIQVVLKDLSLTMKNFNSCKTISCFLSEKYPSLPFFKNERTNVYNVLKIRIKKAAN